MASVSFKHIYKRFPGGVTAVSDFCLEIKDKEFVILVGPSGCGKSTLLNILGLLDNPTSGSYELLGVEVANLKEKERTKFRKGNIGFVFQSYYLMPKMEAVDNVALPLLYADVPLKERRERAAESLGVVGLEDRIHFLPNQMSGGQCQRVAIARAMVTKPALLLADEPTGNLDSQNSAEVIALLREASRTYAQTIVMITHNRSIAQTADRVLQVSDGVLTDFGRCAE
mgnify:CR=1 FL=1